MPLEPEGEEATPQAAPAVAPQAPSTPQGSPPPAVTPRAPSAPVQAVQAPRDFRPIPAPAHSPGLSAAQRSFDAIQGRRLLTEAEARSVAKALSLAAELLREHSDRMEEDDDLQLISAYLGEEATRFDEVLASIVRAKPWEEPKAPAPLPPPLPMRDDRWTLLRAPLPEQKGKSVFK